MALGIRKISVFTVIFSSFIIWIGFYTWRIMFNNFAVEVFDASPIEVGFIQSAREIPGLLAFGAGVLALLLTESRIVALSIVLAGLGLIVVGAAPSVVILGLGTVVLSLGLHYFEPNNTSQLLLLTGVHESGKIQGKLRSFESLAGFTGGVIVLGLTLVLDYRAIFFLIGCIIVAVGGYLALALPANRAEGETRKMTIKKKYWLYYALSFLRGCRRHIFTTFAIFLLVKNYGLDIRIISTIILLNNGITFFTNRLLGNLSDRFGEKTVLVTSSFILTGLFSGYAFVTFLPILIFFYLLDNILFGSSIALKSYLRKISSSEDLTGCLSFGMTANHVTAVIIPILGGLIWDLFGYQATFISGAAIVFVDALLALKIPRKASLAEKNDKNQAE
jgi:predicted MFS family arabinose efflux permease